MTGTAVMLTAAGVLVCLVTALLPGPKSEVGAVVAAPAATQVEATPSAPTSPAHPADSSHAARTPTAAVGTTTSAPQPSA
ncbi:hypothetical protein ACWDYJ_05875 [Streptomyces sp. NPDC003042]